MTGRRMHVEPCKDATNVCIQGSDVTAERDRGDGGRDVLPHARQASKDRRIRRNTPMLFTHDNPGGPVQDFARGSSSQGPPKAPRTLRSGAAARALSDGKRSIQRSKVGDGGLDPGLLEHDLRHPVSCMA